MIQKKLKKSFANTLICNYNDRVQATSDMLLYLLEIQPNVKPLTFQKQLKEWAFAIMKEVAKNPVDTNQALEIIYSEQIFVELLDFFSRIAPEGSKLIVDEEYNQIYFSVINNEKQNQKNRAESREGN